MKHLPVKAFMASVLMAAPAGAKDLPLTFTTNSEQVIKPAALTFAFGHTQERSCEQAAEKTSPYVDPATHKAIMKTICESAARTRRMHDTGWGKLAQ